MLYQFKSQPEDFVVDEQLFVSPQWTGEYQYFLIQKIWYNSMDIVNHFIQTHDCGRAEIGVAWLKDKQSISTQRLSFHESTVAKIGGESSLIVELKQFGSLLQQSRHNEPLTIGANAGNKFTIRLREKKELSPQQQALLTKNLKQLATKKIGNYYGMQRFGKWWRNYHRAREIFENKNYKSWEYQSKFTLSAYQNYHFNQYVRQREADNFAVHDGDIVVDGYSPHRFRVGRYENTTHNVHLFDHHEAKQNEQWWVYHPSLSLSTESFDESTRIPTWPQRWSTNLLSVIWTQGYNKEMKQAHEIDFFTSGREVATEFGITGKRNHYGLWFVIIHMILLVMISYCSFSYRRDHMRRWCCIIYFRGLMNRRLCRIN